MTGHRASAGGEREAFTLIELLVVIAIIALLVSLLMPSLTQAKDLARQSACAAHFKQVGTSLHMYIVDSDDWMPRYQEKVGYDPVGVLDPEGRPHHNWYRATLFSFYADSYERHGRAAPPKGTDGILRRYIGNREHGTEAALSCPAQPRGPILMNVTHAGFPFTAWIWREASFCINWAGTTNADMGEIPISKIADPRQIIFMADGLRMGIYPNFTDDPSISTGSTPTARHFGEFQMVFCDGHVEVGPMDVFYQPQYLINPLR